MSHSGYTLDFNVYTGSCDGCIPDFASKVDEELVQPFKDIQYVSQFGLFISIRLHVQAYGVEPRLCGMCKGSRRQFPVDFKDKRDRT